MRILLSRLLAPVLALSLCVLPASATWSIVVVDVATGEVGVATATCLAGNIKQLVPVVVAGRGAGAAQSVVDNTGFNRMLIRQGLQDGLTPDEILDELVSGAGTTPGQRQYGVASFTGPAGTFTGGGAGLAKGGIVGQVGTIQYAIQGNLLANLDVLQRCEDAFRNHPGDLTQRLLAGMQAATRAGGDGRCSCSVVDPDSCGVPEDFENASLIASMIVARVGDVDGPCLANGCAKGAYYLTLNVTANPNQSTDSVLRLTRLYETWRSNRLGSPDHILSRVRTTTDRLRADGEATTTVTVRLVDVNGTEIDHGGATVEVTSASGLVDLGAVQDNGDGSYSFVVRAGAVAGTEDLTITADDGNQKATLYPPVRLELVGVAEKAPERALRRNVRHVRHAHR